MRASQYFMPTLKETPREAELISHQLMLRGGFIRQVSSGLYTWLPLGLRVLNKLVSIIRTELNQLGAHELLLPIVQPEELWQQSKRWDEYGPLLLKMIDRNKRSFCFGPTHEEVITALMAHEISSYKQLPLICYQIQTKFRDEIRPRFGVMRAREFLMKDAYSFHADETSLSNTYQMIYDAYLTIFKKIGLHVRPVLADNGSIGGQSSHEFHVLAESGEDVICYSNDSDYAANIEHATVTPTPCHEETSEALYSHAIPVNEPNWLDKLKIARHKILTSCFFLDNQQNLLEVILKTEHQVNAIKLERYLGQPVTKAPKPSSSDGSERKHRTIVDIGLINEKNLVMVRKDRSMIDVNLNWKRDLPHAEFADIRNIEAGDISPDGRGEIQLCRGIEVGHIFQLNTTYSKKMQASIVDHNGQAIHPYMGCYGIGVSRIVAAAIEQHHDDKGIIWPEAIAPFQVVIIPVNYQKNEQHQKISEEIYDLLSIQGWEVMLDDRDIRVGVKLAEADLIGYPHRLLISDKTLQANQVEYKERRKNSTTMLALVDILDHLQKRDELLKR